MNVQEKIEFRKLLSAFAILLSQYPNDVDRITRGIHLLEDFINNLLDAQALRFMGDNAKIKKYDN